MDSTMIQQECIDELADYANKKEQVSEITERAMRGELEFEESLTERVSCLKGISVSQMKECYAERITYTPGGKDLISFMKKNGAYTALVSGGFTFFAQFVANEIGFNTYRANELVALDGVLTGEVKPPILGRASKKEALDEFIGFHRLSYDDVIAVGDGANDLDMLNAAGLGVAFHAKPAVAEQARVAINFADLSALTYLQMADNDF
jgi:phosphoserine phosphatase